MNRPIKFMQQLSDGTWHYWGFLKEGCFVGPIANSPNTWSESFEFTGLLDKDGKEIYEGHIVESPYVTPVGEVTNEVGETETVGFCFGRFVLLDSPDPTPLTYWCERTKGKYIPNYGEPTILTDKTLLKISGHIAGEPTQSKAPPVFLQCSICNDRPEASETKVENGICRAESCKGEGIERCPGILLKG